MHKILLKSMHFQSHTVNDWWCARNFQSKDFRHRLKKEGPNNPSFANCAPHCYFSAAQWWLDVFLGMVRCQKYHYLFVDMSTVLVHGQCAPNCAPGENHRIGSKVKFNDFGPFLYWNAIHSGFKRILRCLSQILFEMEKKTSLYRKDINKLNVDTFYDPPCIFFFQKHQCDN